MDGVAFVDTETTATHRIGRPPQPWDGRCRRCEGSGPFYGSDHVCGRCRLADRRLRDSTPGPVRDMALARGRRYAKAVHQRRRLAVIAAYGGRCVCCSEAELAFLTVDHIGGGGNAHRRTLTIDGSIAGSPKFYVWLVRSGFPSGFQLLCHNCNFAKSHGGCPHGNC